MTLQVYQNPVGDCQQLGGVQLPQADIAKATQPGLFDDLPESAFTVDHRLIINARPADRMLLCLALDVSASAVKVAVALAYHGWNQLAIAGKALPPHKSQIPPRHASNQRTGEGRFHRSPPQVSHWRQRRDPVHLQRAGPGQGHGPSTFDYHLEHPNALQTAITNLVTAPENAQEPETDRDYRFGNGGTRGPRSQSRRDYQIGNGRASNSPARLPNR